MGLDSFWKTDQPVKFDPPLNLVGGAFSAFGEGSFRGKAYNSLIQRLTGVSLYQHAIDNVTIRKMAAELRDTPYLWAILKRDGTDEDISAGEYADLQRMFAAYAEAGAVLNGWW